MNLNPRPQAGNYIIHAVLNRGWCPKLFDTETIRIGDYSNDKGTNLEIPVSGNLQLDIVISAYINDGKDIMNLCVHFRYDKHMTYS